MNNPRPKLIALLSILALLALACGFSAPAAPAPSNPELPSALNSTPKVANPTPVVLQPAAPIVASSDDELLVQLYQRANPAVVNILTYSRVGDLLDPSGQGSGFLFDNLGHIVTNSHVVHGADAVEVVFFDNLVEEAQVIGEDLHSDLAVIKIPTLPEGISPLPLGDIRNVAVGQTVIAIGNPFGLGGTLTRGVVSALGRSIPGLASFSIPQAIQTDAPINPGNSGGPLLNLRGEVVGVNAQIETGDGSRVNSGVGFAIPVSIVSRVVPELIQNGKFEWGWMGVSGGSVTPALAEAMSLPVKKGAYVSQVINGSPAAAAGLLGAYRQSTYQGHALEIGGDVIIAIDGQPVSSFDDILLYIALNARPGQTVSLTILRDGQQQNIDLVLGARPTEMDTARQP